MQIFIVHPELDGQETRLSQDVAASATTSTVENNKSFATNDYVVFGNLNEEKTEIVLLTSTSGNTTLGHTTGPIFPHAARTSVSQIRYNQVKIYSSTSEDGTYSLVDTVDLTLDQKYTVYNDSAGTSTTWYKVKYYNATTTSLSSYSVPVQGTGYTDDSLRSMADEVLEDFGDPDGKDLKRDQVYNYLRGGVRNIVTPLMTYYPDYFRAYTTQALTSSTFDVPSRFMGLIRMDINYTGTDPSDASKAIFKGEEFGFPNTTYSETNPIVSMRGNQFVIRPSATTGMAFIWYWRYPEVMTEDDDEHGLPYGARDVLVNYALYKSWLPRDSDKSATYKSLFKDSLSEYLKFVSQSIQNITNKTTEVTSGFEMYGWGDDYYI